LTIGAGRGIPPGAAGRPAAWEDAIAFLALRPRSSEEVRRRLRRRGFSGDETAEVLARLTAAGYLNDAAFAAEWARSRQARQGLGPLRLSRELKAKGIPDGEIAAALDGLRQEREVAEVAAETAGRRMQSLRGLSPEVGRRRLAAYLERRGFPADLILRLCRTHFPRGTDPD